MPKVQLRQYTAHFFNDIAFAFWYIIMRFVSPLITIMILVAVSIKFFTGQDAVDFIFTSLGL
ncbi:hypothetical protein [Helicobacter typhlonius]|uniref:hypothetical protein n=1 Tax=Helicobacter typhlonius TaxID=76936 RepID=UPI002FDFE73F